MADTTDAASAHGSLDSPSDEMSTQFITCLPPPGTSIDNYDRFKYPADQPESIPQQFRDAMSVRVEVFVDEQKVPLEYEFDSDDARSFHFITYASVGTGSPKSKSGSSSKRRKSPSSGNASSNGEFPCTANSVAIGAVRIVPPPHAPHPHAGHEHPVDNAVDLPHELPKQDYPAGPASTFNPDNEPYIKLGRVVTKKQYRKLGIGRMLCNYAVEWAANHPELVTARTSAANREVENLQLARQSSPRKEEHWKGLILVHAQKAIEGWYASQGYVTDKSLGEWLEDGIWHVGMWKRLSLPEHVPFS